MKPLEAWRIVSANLSNFYKMRKTPGFKGWTDADTEAEVICFKALQEMEARERMEDDGDNV